MDIEVSPRGNVSIVKVGGRIVDGPPVESFGKELRKLIEDGKPNTLLDFRTLDWFDSTGIGVLVRHYVSATNAGGRILILGANERIRTLLKMTRLTTFFGFADDLDEGLRWFEGPP